MDDDISKFLARVAQRRAAQAKQQGQPPPKPSAPARPRQPSPSIPPQRMPPAPVVVADVVPEVVPAELAQQADRVEREVEQHLRGSQEIAKRTSQLGKQVDDAQQKLQEHLQQVFDHELGRLSKTASSTAATPHEKPVPDVTLEELRTMLQSPGSVRDAIVLAEILRRPPW